MSAAVDPTLHAIIDAAVRATGAERGWVLGVDDDGFVVLAAVGGGQPGNRAGQVVAHRGAAGFAAASGQPFARRIEPHEGEYAGAGGHDGQPTTVLCAPCGADDVVGVIELVDKEAGFDIADVETVTLLAGVAGAAIARATTERVDVPSPDDLGAELRRLAAEDRRQYDVIAMAVRALLGQS